MGLSFLLASCGSTPQPKTVVPSETPLTRINPATAGSIAGKVIFTGPVPAMPDLDMASNPNCERQHKTPQKAETVLVNPNGTLQNAYIWIKEGLPGTRWTPPAQPATLDQRGCVYGPHVLAVMTGQQVEILNNDPVNHDLHAESTANPPWNESQPPRAEHKFKVFNAPEIMFPMTCNVHPWMRSWIAISPHPFFAVTGPDGTFTLKGVPPGTYTVELVHETLGKKQATVTVTTGATATLDFTVHS